MSAASALTLAEEKRRPREASFGSLSAGLIERGKVPVIVLDEPEPPDPPANDTQPETDIAPAPVFEREWLIPSAEAVAQAEAERTRVRETSFGSLGDGFIERGGALSRQILSAAQIELLLSSEPFEFEELTSLAEEEDAVAEAAAEPEAASEPEAVASAIPHAAPALELLPILQEPSKPIPTPQDFYRAALAEAEPDAEIERPRGRFRSVAIWGASLLVAGVASWLLLEMPELPSFAPTPAVPAATMATSIPELPPPLPLEEFTSLAPPTATETPAAAPPIEAADEPVPAEPIASTPVIRRRPGATEEPAPEAVLPPTELASEPPPPVVLPTVEPKKSKSSRMPRMKTDEQR